MPNWGLPRQREESIMETKNSAQVQANIPNASLSSYEPAKISLADAPSAEAEQLEGYKRAMAAMELAMRVCGDIDPAIYEQAALGIRTQAQAQAEAQGTTLSAMLVDQKISLEQYERMTALQASDMVTRVLPSMRGLAITASSRARKTSWR